MKFKSIITFAFAILCSYSVIAGELYDYSEALKTEFTSSEKSKLVSVTARPRLIEKDFADFLVGAFEKKQTKKDIIKEWRPIQKKQLAEGYVFEVELELKNKNLDSGIEVSLVGDMASKFTLENNLGEHVIMYKSTGKSTSSLNFMTPKVKLLCFFNTKTEKGNPLLKKGVTSLELKIKKLAENIPEFQLKWAVPLNYYAVKRPLNMKSMFGRKPVRTLRAYKTQVYHKSKSSAIPHIKRIKRKEETEEEE